MSTEQVYKLFVKSVENEWIQVGPDFSNWFPFLFQSSLEKAVEHYKKLGLEVRICESTMEFDDR